MADLSKDTRIQKIKDSSIMNWCEGRAVTTAAPYLVYFSLTNACNHKCIFCAQPTVMRDEKGVMSFELFKHIVDQLPQGVRKVYLMKQGESFINKNLEQMARYLKEQRPEIHITMHSNCVLATKDRVRELFKYLDSFGISMDSITKDLYHHIHKKDDFEILMKHISGINEVLEEMPKKDRPHVFVDYIHIKANHSETEDEVYNFFAKQFKNLSSIDFHWENNYQGEIEEANLDIYNKVDYSNFPQCIWPWSAITFLWDGKIDYCFVEPREDVFLGDITQQSFDEIWNGKEYVEFRQNLIEKKYGELKCKGIRCDVCSWLWLPKVQSPRNLVGGYSLQIEEPVNDLVFGDILERDPNQMIDIATQYFLNGEIHRSMGVAQLLLTIARDEFSFEAAKSILASCQKSIAPFVNLVEWNEKLKEESTKTEERHGKFHQQYVNNYRKVEAVDSE